MSRGTFVSIFALFAVACLVLVAGCGNSGSSETLTKAEFEKKAGAICQESQNRRNKIIEGILQKANPKDVQGNREEVIDKGIPTYEEAAQQIDDLGAPKGAEEKVAQLIEAMEEAAEKAKADPNTAITSSVFFRKADKLLEEFKLKGCLV